MNFITENRFRFEGTPELMIDFITPLTYFFSITRHLL